MMKPKIRFREMTLQENVEIVKWAYFEKNETLNLNYYTIQCFPELANIDENLNQDEIYQVIEKVVTKNYEIIKPQIIEKVQRYNDLWDKYNDSYFELLSKYLNINWDDDVDIIDASIGIIPVFPRYLDSRSFAISPYVNDKKVIETAAHESLHFWWFKKWKTLYPKMPREEYDAPYIAWQYSEMVTDPILNSQDFKNLLQIEERTYGSFYNLKDEDSYLMDKLRAIYNSDRSIEEKIVTGYDYVKNFFATRSQQK